MDDHDDHDDNNIVIMTGDCWRSDRRVLAQSRFDDYELMIMMIMLIRITMIMILIIMTGDCWISSKIYT